MVLDCSNKINVPGCPQEWRRGRGCPSGCTSTNSLLSFIWAMTQISLAGPRLKRRISRIREAARVSISPLSRPGRSTNTATVWSWVLSWPRECCIDPRGLCRYVSNESPRAHGQSCVYTVSIATGVIVSLSAVRIFSICKGGLFRNRFSLLAVTWTGVLACQGQSQSRVEEREVSNWISPRRLLGTDSLEPASSTLAPEPIGLSVVCPKRRTGTRQSGCNVSSATQSITNSVTKNLIFFNGVVRHGSELEPVGCRDAPSCAQQLRKFPISHRQETKSPSHTLAPLLAEQLGERRLHRATRKLYINTSPHRSTSAHTVTGSHHDVRPRVWRSGMTVGDKTVNRKPSRSSCCAQKSRGGLWVTNRHCNSSRSLCCVWCSKATRDCGTRTSVNTKTGKHAPRNKTSGCTSAARVKRKCRQRKLANFRMKKPYLSCRRLQRTVADAGLTSAHTVGSSGKSPRS